MYGCLRVRELTKGEFLGALEVKDDFYRGCRKQWKFFLCTGVAPDALPGTCSGLLPELPCRVSSKSPKQL